MNRPPSALRHGILLAALLAGRALVPAAATSGERIQYNRDVRPILSDTCFHCHGPDKNTRKGKLRLDLREEALARTHRVHVVAAGQLGQGRSHGGDATRATTEGEA